MAIESLARADRVAGGGEKKRGFVVGWLATYFFLTPAITRLERSAASHVEQANLLEVKAARAESAGNVDLATQLRAASRSHTDAAHALYATVYARPRTDPTRTRDLDRAILDAATEALDANPTPDEVKAKYDAGPQRAKEVALAIMAEDPSRVDPQALLNSISQSATAIEQYQAMRAALAAAGQLSTDQASQLRSAVQAEVTSGLHFSRDSARYRLAQELLAILAPPPGA